MTEHGGQTNRGGLLVRLLDAESAEWSGAGGSRRGTLAELAEAVAGQGWTLVVPGDAVLLRRIQVPAGSRRRRREAVPFTMEEVLAADVETLHFAFGDDDPERGILTAAVDRTRLEGWLEILHGAGLFPATMVPEGALLPTARGQWALLMDRDSAYLKMDDAGGIACESRALEWVVPAAVTATDTAPARIDALLFNGAQTDLAVDGVEIVPQPCGDDRLAWLRRYGVPAPLNLLQGTYAPRRNELPWRRWAPAAALLLVWLIVALGTRTFQWWQLSHQSRALEAQIVGVFRQTFPGPHRIVNARVQMEQRLEALRAGAAGSGPSVLQMVASAQQAVSATAGVTVTGLDYRNHRLILSVSAADSGTLDHLRRRLGKGGALQAQLEAVNAANGRFSGQLRLEARP